MNKSLQDQLLNTGLIDKSKLKKTQKEKRKQDKINRKNNIVVEDETKLRAEQARQEKIQKDKELNRQQSEAAEQKAVSAQIKQLIEMNRRSKEGGETPYSFAVDKKIKKIYVTEKIQDALSGGRLAIVELEERFEVVPTAVAEKIKQRDLQRLIIINERDDAPEDDDPYKDYQIPDDLMW